MCKISVIIPVYNSEKYLKKCLDSLLNQTMKDVEILVVNDGSTDDSFAILEEYQEKYSQVFIVINQENAGVSVARNRAMDMANGKYVAFIDSDDYIDNDYLNRLYDEAEKYQSDMVFCGYKEVNSAGDILREVKVQQLEQENETYIYKLMTICMRIFRRDFLEKYSILFPEGVRGEDIPFNMMVNALGKNIRAVDYTGYYYVQHNSSAMRRFKGLKEFKLPVREIGEVLRYVNTNECVNSYDFLELCVMRSFTVFLFQFGRKSNRKNLYELCDEIIEVLDEQCPNCVKNPLLSITKLNDFPISHRIAVKFFSVLYKCRLLKSISYVVTRL
ncbi:MAG: glycosyltransferase [Lachnospiraceae bacterium]|nr:glycosyltransferase [Lachnospiraceae bacterium]